MPKSGKVKRRTSFLCLATGVICFLPHATAITGHADTSLDPAVWFTAHSAQLEPHKRAELRQLLNRKIRKTGTTIVGLVFKNGVVLGADTRATNDRIVADKNCEKIHRLITNIYCCGCGTAADAEFITANIRIKLVQHIRLAHMTEDFSAQDSTYQSTERRHGRVAVAHSLLKSHVYEHRDRLSAGLILGGVDVTGPQLYEIQQRGSSEKVEYSTMGSGSLAAMSVLEMEYRPDMQEEEAKAVVCAAVSAGIQSDLGSGSNVDLCVIRPKSVEYLRGYRAEDILPHGVQDSDRAGGTRPATSWTLRGQPAPGLAPPPQLCKLPAVTPAWRKLTAGTQTSLGDAMEII